MKEFSFLFCWASDPTSKLFCTLFTYKLHFLPSLNFNDEFINFFPSHTLRRKPINIPKKNNNNNRNNTKCQMVQLLWRKSHLFIFYIYIHFSFFLFSQNNDIIYNYKLSRRSSDDEIFFWFFSILILVIIIVRGQRKFVTVLFFNWERVSIYLHTKTWKLREKLNLFWGVVGWWRLF